jgi:hypothetical protein
LCASFFFLHFLKIKTEYKKLSKKKKRRKLNN